jgi:hypothetical protein
MLGDVVRTAGRGASDAVGSGLNGLAGDYIGFMLSPWGLLAVGVVFLLIRGIR